MQDLVFTKHSKYGFSLHQCCNVQSLQHSSTTKEPSQLGTTRSIGSRQDSTFVALNIEGQNCLVTPNEQNHNNGVENADATETSSVRFVDERWKQATWDLNMFVKSGKMDWDALIGASKYSS
ncbi:hypothetical protein HanXRQr2_Chr03g0094201 [Helianthus annuus]|uniref:Uncharacterized protein n=1 Tax=Helianthus annuus TaxID=4232 RepID=A0A9K3JDF4_HELAN|nr:hypothetical protein HanXRQr2_Chr03g0094201 [Helianthus annuus]